MNMGLTLPQALAWLPGGRLVGPQVGPITRVHTDSRSIEPGDLFVALRGERFDGNDLLQQARAAGAVATLCHPGASGGLAALGWSGIEVPDTLAALGQLAAGWRRQFVLPLIAVTGSNGKTTVTQMIAAILRAAVGAAALATQGNFNNAIGVPLTLLRLRPQHRLAVLELGMNHPGEIAQLAALVQPTVALVNNAQREHLEFMATVAAVAQENAAVLAALGPQGCAVFPADDDYSAFWSAQAGSRPSTTFALQAPASVHAEALEWVDAAWRVRLSSPAGPLHLRLHVAGRHNLKNALAAVACALAAGLPVAAIEQGLQAFEPVKGRSRVRCLQQGDQPLTLIDDSYNANPDSVRAAIELLAELPAPRLLVLGDMGEVGAQGPAFHAEAGASARARGIEQLLTLGQLAQQSQLAFGAGRHFVDMAALQTELAASLPTCASVLVKGSRFMQMERAVAFIEGLAVPAAAATDAFREPGTC